MILYMILYYIIYIHYIYIYIAQTEAVQESSIVYVA